MFVRVRWCLMGLRAALRGAGWGQTAPRVLGSRPVVSLSGALRRVGSRRAAPRLMGPRLAALRGGARQRASCVVVPWQVVVAARAVAPCWVVWRVAAVNWRAREPTCWCWIGFGVTGG